MSALQYDGIMLNQNPNASSRTECDHRRERRFHWQSALLLETVRRQTFSNWTVSHIDRDKLAAAGFFHLRTLDHVQCVFCQGIVGYWEPGDQPEVEHRKHFPNCPLITGAATGNVPIEGEDDTSTELFKFLDEYHTFRVASTRPQQSTTSIQTDSARVPDGGQLAYPLLNTIANRLQTYSRWPKNVGVGPDVLAEAGFFSTGLADWVQCFHCGGGLYGWHQGDNPIADHARFFPFCPFARAKLGEDAVTLSRLETPPPMPNCRSVTLTENEAELILHHPIAKRLVGMGLSQVSVREALKHRLETRGVLCRTVTEALELVFDYEEIQRRNNNINTLCHDGPQSPTQVVNMGPIPTPMMHMPSINPFCPGPATQDSHNPHAESDCTMLLAEVEALRQQVIVEESRLLCRLCRKTKVEVVFQPCSHLHLCAECARPRDTCSTCGAIVRGTLRPIIG